VVLPRLLELVEPFEDVLLLREPGGEDVRVAMVTNLRQSHTRHTDHTPGGPAPTWVRGCQRMRLGKEWIHVSTIDTTHHEHLSMYERMHVPRSRGVVTGFLLLVLGVWGGLIPFIGPEFGFAYTPDDSWHFTWGRLWLEILPGVAAALGGLWLLGTSNRLSGSLGGWLAAAGGAWFVVGQSVSQLWNDGVPAAGSPTSSTNSGQVLEQIGFFTGVGVAIVFLAAFALGRLSVVGVRDVRSARDLEEDSPPEAEDERPSILTGRRVRQVDET
jgi:hypothetical protein